MSKTKIQWTDEVWNPVTGCTPVSEGCRNCYAKRMAHRLAGRYGYPKEPHEFDVTLRPERLDIPLRRKKPAMYFACSMSDLFHEDVPTEFIYRVIHIMARSLHVYQILTKRPHRMSRIVADIQDEELTRFDKMFPRVWLGVSVENQAAADERIPLLLQTPAAVRFVSVEPMLSAVDLTRLDVGYLPGHHGYRANVLDSRIGPLDEPYKHLDWVICGGESGPGARPMHPDWARSLRDQCQAAGTPYFFKQHGAWLHGSQFALKSSWAELRRDGARVHGRPVNWRYEPDRTYHWPDGSTSYRVGKKRAGHLLDGRTWQQFPAADGAGTVAVAKERR